MLAKREIDWQQYNQAEEVVFPRKQQAEEKKLNFRLRRRCLMLAAVLTLFAAATTARSDTLNQAGFDLVALKRTESEMLRNTENLQIEVAKLQSLERIKLVATQQLGMQQAAANWYVKAGAPEKRQAPSGGKAVFVQR